MDIKDVLMEFDKEFNTLKTRDGVNIPLELDPDFELKERFVKFLIKTIK